jgi:hypothetical protein
MAMTTEQRRTVEARLDRLQRRIQRARAYEDVKEMGDCMQNIVDVLRDVLLPMEGEGQ